MNVLDQLDARILLLPLLLVTIAACGPVSAQELARVTPLPEGTLTRAPATVVALGSETGIDAINLAEATPLPAATSAPAEVVAVEKATSVEQIATEQADRDALAGTPTPLDINPNIGNAAVIAAATDAVVQPTPRTRVTFDDFPVALNFDDFYDGFNMRSGLILSDKLVSLDGQEVMMEGYMAPPLKAEIDYFVLTAIRLEFCPFCSTAADWPTDIAVVYLMDDSIEVTTEPLRITGRLEVGQSQDAETGMVSLVRIYAEEVEPIRS